MNLTIIGGARPNFMKIAPIMREIAQHPEIKVTLIHTGQHYDFQMSQVFFQELGIPDPDIFLGIGSGSHGEQTGKALIELDKILTGKKPDCLVVVGDVNSTLAGALAAAKLCIPVAHVESGLRSFDMTMPEEINRVLTDRLSQVLFTPSEYAGVNLTHEGISPEKICLVGDVMVDSLFFNLARTANSDILKRISLTPKEYALVTIHRPVNVDERGNLQTIIRILASVSRKIRPVLPLHPRTMANIVKYGLQTELTMSGAHVIEPAGYIDFITLEKNARFIMTDSGGVQLESSVLNIPCLTMRETTERPETVSDGTSTLVSLDEARIKAEVDRILTGSYKTSRITANWDGKASSRIVKILSERFTAPN